MYTFKDPAGLTKVAVACVGTYLLFDLLFGLSLANDYFSGEGYLFPEDGPTFYLALLRVASLVVSIVAVATWIYRASANAHTFSTEMTIKAGWAVGWYFVPIMNLFRPFQAMREIWLATHFRGNWHGEPTPSILGWWWGLWIVTNILGNVSWRLSGNPDLVDAAFMVDMAATTLNVPLCLALITIVRTVARRQAGAVHDEVFA